MLDPPATAAARDEPAEGGIPPTLSQRVLLTLPESSLDVALAASLESKAASRAKIWKGILARSAPSLAAVAALPPPTGAGSDPSEPSPWSTPQTSPSLAAASSRGGGVPSARREASFGVRIKRTLTAAHWKVPDIIPLQASLVHHRKVPFKGLVVCWQLLLGTPRRLGRDTSPTRPRHVRDTSRRHARRRGAVQPRVSPVWARPRRRLLHRLLCGHLHRPRNLQHHRLRRRRKGAARLVACSAPSPYLLRSFPAPCCRRCSPR